MSAENAWLEGFCEYACQRGVPAESIPVLVKAAALLRLNDNPDFVAGFEKQCAEAGISKEAAPMGWLGKLLIGALTGVGAFQAGKGALQGGNWLYRQVDPYADAMHQSGAMDKARVAENMARARINAVASPFDEIRRRQGMLPSEFSQGTPVTQAKPWLAY